MSSTEILNSEKSQLSQSIFEALEQNDGIDPSEEKASDSEEDSNYATGSMAHFGTTPDSNLLKESRTCSVCGDSAFGCNFGAITCESCKAFFRRNAYRIQTLQCIFNSNCKIDKHTRRFCSYCRMQKCVKASMKKENILGEEQRRQRQEKVRVNRDRRSRRPRRAPGTAYDVTNRAMNKLSSEQQLSAEIAACQLTSPSSQQPAIFDAGRQQQLNIIDGSWLNDINFPLSNFYPQSQPNNPHCSNADQVSLNDNLSKFGRSRLLSHEQWASIDDLRQAYEFCFITGGMAKTPNGDYTLNNLVNTSGFIVRKMINFSKKLSDFSTLSQECQIVLLKGVVLHTIFLLSASHYDVAKDSWITSSGGAIPTRILMFATGFNAFYEEHASYCKSFQDLISNDTPLIALMQVLCLFNPERQNIPHPQQVSNVHDRYVLLLKHYLEARYGFTDAQVKLSAILANLVELQFLTEKHGSVLLHVDPSQVDPLMLEIFNLHERTRDLHLFNPTAEVSPTSLTL